MWAIKQIVSIVVASLIGIAAALLVVGILAFAASTIVAIVDISGQIITPIERPFK